MLGKESAEQRKVLWHLWQTKFDLVRAINQCAIPERQHTKIDDHDEEHEIGTY